VFQEERLNLPKGFAFENSVGGRRRQYIRVIRGTNFLLTDTFGSIICYLYLYLIEVYLGIGLGGRTVDPVPHRIQSC
jgi:hypothetical protein